MPFRKERELYRSFFEITGFYPNHIELYKQALTHKSHSYHNGGNYLQSNERLEFLGDAILDAVVGDIVYKHFPNKNEGFLTNARSRVVQRETLGKVANDLGLSKLIQSHEFTKNHNCYLSGNAFEAIVGAIYLDKGYACCQQFVQERILKELINLDKIAYKEVNFKSKFLEWCQKYHLKFEFRLLSEKRDENGSSHFHTMILVEGVECSTGSGYSKKESHQAACQSTLKQLKKNKKLEGLIFEKRNTRLAIEQEGSSSTSGEQKTNETEHELN